MYSLGNKIRKRKTKNSNLRKSEDDLSTIVKNEKSSDQINFKLNNLESFKLNLPSKSLKYKVVQMDYEKLNALPNLFDKEITTPFFNKKSNESFKQNTMPLYYQRQLSKSVGDNLQQFQFEDNYVNLETKLLRSCLSTGDLLSKTHEELILILIQYKRNQSNLKNTIEKLEIQIESEEKLISLEPQKIAEHKLNYDQFKKQLIEARNLYETQMPIVEIIENMVKHNKTDNLKNNAFNSTNEISINKNFLHSDNMIEDQNFLNKNFKYEDKNKTYKANTSIKLTNNLKIKTNNLNVEYESDYAGESDTCNFENSYTSLKSSRQDSNENINIQTRKIGSVSQIKKNEAINVSINETNQENKFENSNSTMSTNSSVINISTKLINSKQDEKIFDVSNEGLDKNTKNIFAEEEMKKMKKQQILLEAELKRIREMILKSQINKEKKHENNESTSHNSNSIESIFHDELKNIDEEIKNLSAKKEKLIQNLKNNQNDKLNDSCLFNSSKNFDQKFLKNKLQSEDLDILTDDDTVFSIANSICLDSVLNENNSLNTKIQDLELSKLRDYENEYVQSLKAEHEQNLKQQEEERKKLEEKKKLEKFKENSDDEKTTETTIYKTLRLVKSKYEKCKLNNQLPFDCKNAISVKIENEKLNYNAKHENCSSSKNKVFEDTFNDKIIDDENFKFKENKTDNLKQSNIDDNLLPSELSQLLLDSALIIYEQLKPPKRSTGSSVSSERSITDEQSDDDVIDLINQKNLIKQPQSFVKTNSIYGQLDSTNLLKKKLKEKSFNIKDNSIIMNELYFDKTFNYPVKMKDNLETDNKKKINPAIYNRGCKVNKKKVFSEKNTFSNNQELEEERTRIY